MILGEEPISLVDQGGWILVNAGQTSFTRVNYTPQLLLRLQPAFRDLGKEKREKNIIGDPRFSLPFMNNKLLTRDSRP